MRKVKRVVKRVAAVKSAVAKKEVVEMNATLDEPKTELEFPPLAMALLLDEWRRATMEGQGGMFVRLPRERYDGAGNLWSVVRRPFGEVDRIVLVREAAHYQARAASCEAARVESEIGRKTKVLEASSSALEAALRVGDSLKAASIRETSEALEADLAVLASRLGELREAASAPSVQEWEFPLGLEGVSLKVEGGG